MSLFPTVWCLAVFVPALLAVSAIGCDRDGHQHGHDHAHNGEDHAHGGHPSEHARRGQADVECDDPSHDHSDPHDHTKHGDDDHAGHEHSDHPNHVHRGHDGSDDSHSRGTPFTGWGRLTQLFVEVPPLVVGQSTELAAHMTWLAGHRPIEDGEVTVELSGGGAPTERFSIGPSSVAGIFRPLVTPGHAATRTLTIRYEAEMMAESHAAGEHTAWNTEAEAKAGTPYTGPPVGAISLTIEEQWGRDFRVSQASTAAIRPSVRAFGTLVVPSDSEVVVKAPRAGRVSSEQLRVGTKLDKGATLVTLATAFEERVEPADIALDADRARIRAASARREVNRLKPLVAKGVVAVRRLDAARASLAEAQAELRAAKRRRDNVAKSNRLGSQGDAYTVPSPIAGVVADVYTTTGSWVQRGAELARLVARDHLWLEVGIPEAFIGQLKSLTGGWYRFGKTGPLRALDQHALVSVASALDPATRTLPVRFAVDNTQQQLFAGMSTQLRLYTDTAQDAVVVPYSALVDDAGVDVVYVQLGGETFERRQVRVGVRDGDLVAVEGVASGEWIATKGAYAVKLAATATTEIGHGHDH